MISSRMYQTLAIILLILSSLVVGCTSPDAEAEADQVTVQLSWFHNNEFIGFYIAQQEGFYADENLEVTLKPGGPEVDSIEEVLAGNAQFGTIADSHLIQARAAGEDLVAVASIFRNNPLFVMAMADSDIHQPQDLTGKTVGVISPDLDTPWDIQFLAMLKAADVDASGINMAPIEDYHGAEEILSGRVQAASGFFWVNEAVQAKLDGHETRPIFYSDYGILSYVNPLFTTGQSVREQPDLVERFVRATLKGYRYAIENPQEAVKIVEEYDKDHNLAYHEESMEAQIAFIDTGDAPVGWMDEIVWENIHEILLDQGVIDAPVDLDQVYTNEFVEKAQ